MTDFANLRISFYFEPRDGVPHAPDGPGFYLAAVRNDSFSVGGEATRAREVVPRVRIPNEEMARLAKVLDNFVKDKPLNWSGDRFEREDISLEQAVLESIEYGKKAIGDEVARAEQAIKRLDRLRQIQEEFDA